MILPRIFACLLGLAALLLSFYVYEEYIQLLGLPDGHVTDLGAAEKKLAMVFVVLSVVSGSLLIFLGSAGRGPKARKLLLAAIVLYLLVVVCTVALDHYYQSYLDNGVGG